MQIRQWTASALRHPFLDSRPGYPPGPDEKQVQLGLHFYPGRHSAFAGSGRSPLRFGDPLDLPRPRDALDDDRVPAIFEQTHPSQGDI